MTAQAANRASTETAGNELTRARARRSERAPADGCFTARDGQPARQHIAYEP